jgi:hypothetical protein
MPVEGRTGLQRILRETDILPNDSEHSSYIVGEALPFIIPLAGATVIAFVSGFYGVGLFLFGLTAFVIGFFRNPQRTSLRRTAGSSGLRKRPAMNFPAGLFRKSASS